MGSEVLPCPLDCMEPDDLGLHHMAMADPVTEVLGNKSKQRWVLYQSMTPPTEECVVLVHGDLLHFLEVTVPCKMDQSLPEYFCYAQRDESISTGGDHRIIES